MKTFYTLTDVERGAGPRARFVYACLRDPFGVLVISATLPYILAAATQRGYAILESSVQAALDAACLKEEPYHAPSCASVGVPAVCDCKKEE